MPLLSVGLGMAGRANCRHIGRLLTVRQDINVLLYAGQQGKVGHFTLLAMADDLAVIVLGNPEIEAH